MKRLFFLFSISLFVLSATAQLRPGSLIEIENNAWSPYYRTEKVKKVSVYTSDEYNRFDRAYGPNETREYDNNGKLITMTRYKYNWSKKTSERLSVDSFFYSPFGLIRYRSYDPSGGYLTLSVEGVFTNSVKGDPIKQEYYRLSNDHVLAKEETTTISYDPKTGNLKKLNSVNSSPSMSYNKTFITDGAGRITKSTKKDDGLFPVAEEFSWKPNGTLDKYREYYGKDLNKTYSYSYDGKGRRIGKQEEGQTFNVAYSYNGDSNLPVHILTTQNGLDGKNDIRHFHEQLVYEYY